MEKEKNSIRLRPLGAIGTVTGSCTLLEYYCASEDKKHYFLVDAGAYQNESCEREDARQNILKYYAPKIEAVFLTHAHLDHIGLLPTLIESGFGGKVYCTQATHDLVVTMLTDGIPDKAVKKKNWHLLGKVTFNPIDTGCGTTGAVEMGKKYIPIAWDLRLGFLRTAHILGAVSFYFQWTEKVYPKDQEIELAAKEWKYLHFSGDVGVNSEEVRANILYKPYHTPQWEKETCIVMESTYGNRNRQKENIYENKMERLTQIIDASNARNGKILIPAFALDRAQQVLLDLYCVFRKKENLNHQMEFTVDSPLVEKVNKIYIRHLTDEVFSRAKQKRKLEYLSDDFLKEFGIRSETDDKQKGEIKKVLQTFLETYEKPAKPERIVVTSSGMCDQGKVQTLLGEYLRDEKATVILTGFQATDTVGYLLKNLAAGNYEENNAKETTVLKLANDEMRLADVKCTIEDMSAYYSGHADQEQILNYLTPSEKHRGRVQKTSILLNHGTEESRRVLKAKIEERNPAAKVILPEFNKWFDIVSHEVSETDAEDEVVHENTQEEGFTKLGEIMILFPVSYDEKKRKSIVNFINGL